MEKLVEHRHRRPTASDFQGKTIIKFSKTADNIWKFWFSDGSKLAIQCDLHHGLAVMVLCEECAL